MIRTRTWILLFAAAAVVLGALSWYLLSRRTEGCVVQIVQDGTVLREIDLSRVTGEERIVIESPYGGSNVVLVRPGRICVAEADCPDGICVHQGWLESGGSLPIVCLPHRLVILVKDPAPDTDAVGH